MDDYLAGAEFRLPFVAFMSLLTTYLTLMAALVLLWLSRTYARKDAAAPLKAAPRDAV